MTKHAGGALLPSISIDRGSATPVSSQLARGLRDAILGGLLRPGDRLPSSRTLAAELGLSRTTVVDVYDQLTAEELIISRVGAGAFVSAAIVQPARPPKPARPPRPPARLARLAQEASQHLFPRLSHPPAPRAFVTGTPAYDLFPLARWAAISARIWRGPRAALLRYPAPSGLPALREAIAAHLRMNRGIHCAAEEIFVFDGAQGAFNRIAELLLDPGDAVWFENPGHIGARNSFVAAGARLVPVAVDADGIDVAAGLAACPDFRLAFVTPAHQQPLGIAMSLERRLALLAAAEAAEAWIVEDDHDGDFWFDGRRPTPLRSIDQAGRVIHVGSFSKTLFPALRIGFLVAPPELAEVFERVGGAVLPGAATSLQATLAAFLTEGHYAAHVRRMRKIYAERHAVLIETARRELGGLLEVHPTASGLQTSATLAPGIDEEATAAAAAARGVTVAPVSRFCLEPRAEPMLALGFAAVPPREIVTGVAALADVIGRSAVRRTG